MNDDTYFLSPDNPVANIDQRDLELRAMTLMTLPAVQKAKAVIAHLYRDAVAWPCRDQMAEFDDMVTEFVFWNALYAANGDAGYPRVLRVMEPPLRSFGRDLPGSRWGGDCPDFIYRSIPMELGGRYEVRAEPSCADPPLTNYTLMGASMSPPANIAVVENREMRTDQDGTLVLHVDARPGAEGANHIQSKPGTHYLLIRDAIADWQTQSPSRLRVRRLDTPAQGPRSDEDLAEEAARRAMETFFFCYYVTRSGNGLPPNQLSTPMSSGASGGMPTQWSTKGTLELADDEALIVTVTAAGALYRNVQLSDVFHRSMNYRDRTSALNVAQMAPDDDSRFTYVVAHEDPGVHNWLDTGGRNHCLIGHRWQNFENGTATEAPTASTRLVKLGELPSALPAGVTPITPAGRERQLADRKNGYQRRLIGR